MRNIISIAALVATLSLASTGFAAVPNAASWRIIHPIAGVDKPTPNAAPYLTTANASQPNLNFYARQTPLVKQANINPQQNADATVLVSPMYSYDTLHQPAQLVTGSVDLSHSFNGWQHITKFDYFGGSYGEGQVLAPSPGMIHAAHKNGVKILGTVFFVDNGWIQNPPSDVQNQQKWMDAMLTPNAQGNYPYADDLILIAHKYGFDGYFINNESNFTTDEQAKYVKFIQYIHTKAPDLNIDWYERASGNYDLLSSSQNHLADETFLDYGLAGEMSSYHEKANALGKPGQIYMGLNAETPGVDWHSAVAGMFANNQKQANVDIFDAAHIVTDNLTNSNDINMANLNQDKFWQSISDYTPTFTAITQLPFVTNFSTGQGSQFFIHGNAVMKNAWNSMALQDYLPTWQFDNSTQGGNALTANLDYSTAFAGGDSLAIKGTLGDGSTTTYKLFATALNLTSSDDIVVRYQLQADASTKTNLLLTIQDKSKNTRTLTLPLNGIGGSDDWQLAKFDLSQFAGNQIKQIAIVVNSGTHLKDTNYMLHIGKVFVGDKTLVNETPAAPTAIKLSQDQQLSWQDTQNKDPNIYYDIYYQKGGQFIARTYQRVYAMPAGTSTQNICVRAVNELGNESACGK